MAMSLENLVASPVAAKGPKEFSSLELMNVVWILFSSGSISNIDEGESSCRNTSNHEIISGVVGAPSSVTSIQVAHLLRLFKIPQVSFFSTSPELSNKQRFEYFSRTIPSDQNQVRAMVEIIKMLNWTYISILYEESNYGIKGFEELETLLSANDICIAVKEKLAKDSGTADKATYDHIVDSLLTKPTARGVVIFASDQEVASVMRAVQRRNATERFTWIGSDGWSARALVSTGNEKAVEGTLSVQPRANQVAGFKEYFNSLTIENNKRNPWFVEFWEHVFDCRWPGSPATPHNMHHTKRCTGTEKMTNTEFEGQLQFVSDAVFAFAYAFRDLHRDLCGKTRGLCAKMMPVEGQMLLPYLRNVSFTGLSGDQFQFDSNGDGPARYAILHYKQIAPGHWEWIEVGKYENQVLHLNMSAIQYKYHKRDIPESVCSRPCQKGEKKTYVEGEICCWHCINCTQFEILNPNDDTQCYECKQGELPNSDKTKCEPLPEDYLQPTQAIAIGAMAFATAGICITGFIIAMYVKNHDTPVVRASSRELSYVLLSGIFMCYGLTFILVLRPTHIVCGVQQFMTGFCFTVVYSALFTKTNRIARIFEAGKKSAKRPSFISPKSQLLICAGLVFVQVIVNVIWMLVQPPVARNHYPTPYDNLFVCEAFIEFDYMIAFAYPILLIVSCTVYAVLTRKIPEDYNESKYIGFAMYTTCIIWLAFVTIYFVTAAHIQLRIVTTCISVSLSATVAMVCLFTPKMYVIILHPEKNVRQSMMKNNKQYSAINKGGPGAAKIVTRPPVQTVSTATQYEDMTATEVEETTQTVGKSSPNSLCIPDGNPPMQTAASTISEQFHQQLAAPPAPAPQPPPPPAAASAATAALEQQPPPPPASEAAI
ncbi:unnamed protein product [Notodromas monacha]|uniref:G-protein coupled receptors family 3 profile domain-containing protein n=1 Tax=Notodromas monacha TaxID=399045 RepID=A0A7R9GED6_9CRUS|nr:unnamed protein product [Notodromas monacha]CAG0918157.1 unnamed protein product [Notodromas monacha]